jgi:membrane protein EpsK
MSQVKKNLLFNSFSLLINIGIGIFYTPYLVRSLGIMAYGIIPLAMIINQYVTILTTSLTGSLTRFYAIEIEKKNFNVASKYLSTSLFVIILIVAITIPFFILVIINIDEVFNIPIPLINSAKILFNYTFLSFYLSIFSSFFNITLYAQNRLDVLNIINISRSFTKICFNVLFFEFITFDIKYIGISNFLAECSLFIISYYFFKRLNYKEVDIKIKHFEKASLLTLGLMTLWVLVHQIGDLTIYKINVFFINKFWSSTESGIIGAITDFGSYIIIVVGVITTLLGPLILQAFSKKNYEEVKELAIKNSLIIGVITSIATSLLICFAPQFLKLWLGHGFENYSLWFILKMIDLPFFAAAGVFSFVYRSWNEVKIPAILTVMIGLLNTSINYVFCKLSNGDEKYITYILIFSAICSFIQAYGLGIFMLKKIYNEIQISTLLYSIPFKFISVFIFVYLFSQITLYFFSINIWIELISCFVGIGSITLLFSYKFLIPKETKKYISDFLIK